MTEKDKRDIAKFVAKEMEGKAQCPHGIDAETAASLKEFSQTWQSGKKNAVVTFVAGVVAGLGALITLGITKKLETLFK